MTAAFAHSPLVPFRESPQTLLARNLVVARVSVGVTQHALASSADVSRATIAQIETGCADPRLSTIAGLAGALGIPSILLLLGPEELNLLATLAERLAEQPAPPIPIGQLEKLKRLVDGGMLKDRVRAGRLGAEIARSSGFVSATAPITAAICSAINPDLGVRLGALLGEIFADQRETHP